MNSIADHIIQQYYAHQYIEGLGEASSTSCIGGNHTPVSLTGQKHLVTQLVSKVIT